MKGSELIKDYKQLVVWRRTWKKKGVEKHDC